MAEEDTHRMIEEEETEADPQKERREEEEMEEVEEEEVKRKDGMIEEARVAQRKETTGMSTFCPPSKTSKARSSSRKRAKRI